MIQRGVCTLPDGRKLSLTVNDEEGASTPEGDVRVFAGLRSDPFYLAWDVGKLKKVPNLLQHDNVLCMVVELDTRRVLDPAKGSLFGAIAETVPIPQPPSPAWTSGPAASTGSDAPSRPTYGSTILRWPGSTIYATCGISRRRSQSAKELQPLFLQRLKDSFAVWDGRDGKADWTPDALAANANVFLDDFLLFDVAKPITDQSHLEIEKSTLYGRPYQTGGGRTVDANVIDILLTWLVNRDREFLQGGATGATKPGMKVFPYFATPNTELQTVADSVELAAAPDDGVVGDRTVQSRLASRGRAGELDRRGNRATPQDRNARRQGNRRTPRSGRQREAVLSLRAGCRRSRVPLRRNDRRQADEAAARSRNGACNSWPTTNRILW